MYRRGPRLVLARVEGFGEAVRDGVERAARRDGRRVLVIIISIAAEGDEAVEEAAEARRGAMGPGRRRGRRRERRARPERIVVVVVAIMTILPASAEGRSIRSDVGVEFIGVSWI